MGVRPRPRRRGGLLLGALDWLHRNSAYLFLCAVCLAFLRAGLHTAIPPSPSTQQPQSYAEALAARARAYLALGPRLEAHPIPALMDTAEARFRAKVAKQSLTLPLAVAEYKRRYGRAPPKGFDAWWAFAQRAGFVMVDEFDAVFQDLKGFWAMSGEEVRRRVEMVGGLPSVDLVQIRRGKARAVSGGKGFKDSEAGARAKGFKSMLDASAKNLPDMDFPVNAKAEGRVVVPWEHTVHPNLTNLNPAFPSPDWKGQGSVWDAWRRTCPPSSPARRLFSSLGSGWAGASGAKDRLAEGYYAWQARLQGAENRADGKTLTTGTTSEFDFVPSTGASSADFCAHPGDHYEQGHFFSDWRTYPLLVPMFSPARAQGFGDIRIPSHYYYGGTRRYTYAWDPINLEQRATDPMEVPWEQKRDAVWWRGASTGGGSSPPGFGAGYQRHRFLRMSSVGYVPEDRFDGERSTAVTFDVPNDPGFRTTNVPLSDLNREVMDVAFVKEAVRIDPRHHRIGDSVELGVSWGYKYLLDLDGMGYSGRFMAFLASDSVPVKNTMYDEFFSDWIEPWVHYIPLSPSYAEIYNIVTYFSGPSPAVLSAAGLSGNTTAGYFGAPRDDAYDDDDDEWDEEEDWDVDHDDPMHDHAYEEAQALERQRLRAEMRTAVNQSRASGEGDVRLRRIARAGKQWKSTMGRKVDMEVYVYRLALEFARLLADDRDAMSYKG
uniref:Glycosyl transferase CAP10 domain-containing protein n=1 Tax=Mycena chlorophos TaxID=658473 RepID=A0ABQ0LEF2_MYCCL|nr:predicted protein [Mycena chlorophos]